jgi:two-component system cell cycle sensor histidine kinase/response regulator CckA
MVVDDDPALLGFTCKYLTRLGYSAIPYRSSEEAWKHFEASGLRYSLALIDRSMPVISGEQLSRMMSNLDPEVRLILTSGYPFDTASLLDLPQERLAFLHKPFTPAMLAETVDRLLRGGEKDHAD